jgi:hypothetical protein
MSIAQETGPFRYLKQFRKLKMSISVGESVIHGKNVLSYRYCSHLSAYRRQSKVIESVLERDLWVCNVTGELMGWGLKTNVDSVDRQVASKKCV